MLIFKTYKNKKKTKALWMIKTKASKNKMKLRINKNKRDLLLKILNLHAPCTYI